MADQVYETVLRKEVRHSLAPRYPRFVEVHAQFPGDNGVPEALKGLLQVRQVLQHRRRYVRANKWGPGESVDNLAAYHVLPVVAHGLNPPPDGPLPCHHPNAALSFLGAGRPRLQTCHVVAEAIVRIRLRLYLRLSQQHHVKAPALHRPDGLCQPESPAILDV